MRDFASCFSDHAVRVSDSSCSGTTTGFIAVDPSIQTSVSCLYKTKSPYIKQHVLINITWSKAHPTIVIDDCRKTTQLVLHIPSGKQSIASRNSEFNLYWDFSAAKYGNGPEPLSGFTIAVSFKKEIILMLGEMPLHFTKQLTVEASLLYRREQVLGMSNYVTKTRFRENGPEHDINIRCRGDNGCAAGAELVVYVDKKRVVQVRRMEYNFRGNQTLFVDGSPVDLMWDVHGWWFGGDHAVFMFRARSALQSRLWLEEEMLRREKGEAGFSLVIQVFKAAENH